MKEKIINDSTGNPKLHSTEFALPDEIVAEKGWSPAAREAAAAARRSGGEVDTSVSLKQVQDEIFDDMERGNPGVGLAGVSGGKDGEFKVTASARIGRKEVNGEGNLSRLKGGGWKASSFDGKKAKVSGRITYAMRGVF